MDVKEVKFWLEDPSILLTDTVLVPTSCMTKVEKLNALTRLVLIITGVLYFMKNDEYLKFLLISLIIIVVIYVSTKDKIIENYGGGIRTFIPDEPTFTRTIIEPVYSESQRMPTLVYDHAESREPSIELIPSETVYDIDPRSYPYGQYMSRTNLLPSDEKQITRGSGRLKDAKTYANSTYLVNNLKHREEMIRIHHKKINRRFRHGTNNTVSPFSSW